MASIRKNKKKKGYSYTVLYDVEIDGVRHQKSAGTYDSHSEAQKVKRDLEQRRDDNTFVEPSQMTVEQLVTQWLPIRAKLKEWSFSTHSTAEKLLKDHIISAIGHRPVQQLTSIEMEMLFNKLSEKRVGKRRKKRVLCDKDAVPFLSGSTLSYLYVLIKCALDAAVNWKIIAVNPINFDKPKKDSPEAAFWTIDMVGVALDMIEDDQLHLATHQACTTTMRIGEICAVTWDCVNYAQQHIIVNKTMQRVQLKSLQALPRNEVIFKFPIQVETSKSVLILKEPKTDSSERIVVMTHPFMQELRRREQMVAKNKLYYGDDYKDYNLVFCLDDGSPLEPNLLEKWFRVWQRKNPDLGLPYLKFHELRHTGATLLSGVSNGDIKVVQSFTGHKSSRVLMDTYTHTNLAAQQDLVKRLEKELYSNSQIPEEIEKNERTEKLNSQDSECSEEIRRMEEIMILIKKDPLFAQELQKTLLAVKG